MKLESFTAQCIRIGREAARSRGVPPEALSHEERLALAREIRAEVEAHCLKTLRSRQGAAALESVLEISRREAEELTREIMEQSV